MSCMEVEQPVCNDSNAVDIPNLPALAALNLVGERFELQQTQMSFSKIGVGQIMMSPAQGGQGVLARTCRVSGKTFFQVPTEHNTYMLYAHAISSDAFSLSPYVMDRRVLDAEGIPYQIVTRGENPMVEKFSGSGGMTQDVLVVERLTESDLSHLYSQAFGFTFVH